MTESTAPKPAKLSDSRRVFLVTHRQIAYRTEAPNRVEVIERDRFYAADGFAIFDDGAVMAEPTNTIAIPMDLVERVEDITHDPTKRRIDTNGSN